MNVQLLAPLAVAAICSSLALLLLGRISPKVAVVFLSSCIALTTAVSFVLLVQLSAAGLSEIPIVSDAIGWCRALYDGQHGASPFIGLAAVAGLAFVVVRAAKYLHSVREVCRSFADLRGVEIVETDRPLAFSVPGRNGGVVMSRSLLEALDRSERHALLAHENAHLRHHHHLYVHFAGACAAGLPFLRPWAQKVRFLTERWADEVAAERVGSRTLVATTIAKVALLPSSAEPRLLSMGETAVLERFDALQEPLSVLCLHTKLILGGLMTVTVSGALLQIHQLVEFISHSGHA